MSFPATYKSDWGITTQGTTVRLYDSNRFFYGNLGRFPRPVNNSNRYPGSTENDAIRDIIAGIGANGAVAWQGATGAFSISGSAAQVSMGSPYSHGLTSLTFRASATVPTAAENRPYNVGLTPAFYLGV